MSKFLDLKSTLKAVDMRDKDFYDKMSDEDKKKYSPYMLMRYTASVKSDQFYTEHYIETVNECVNKNLWTLSKSHKKLLWMLTSMCGAFQVMFHPWLAGPKKEAKNKQEKMLRELYPNKKLDEIELMLHINDKKELKQLAKDYGYDDKQLKDWF